MMTLYGYWRSSAAYRIRIALNMKGVTVNHVSVNLKDGEQREAAHLARNPQGLLPVLELEDGTQLTQSLAIMDYLDATYRDPDLMPREALQRAKVLSASLVIAADTHPIQNSSVLGYLKSHYGADQASAESWARHFMDRSFRALEHIAADRTTKFMFADRPAFFEICLIPQVYNARRFGLDMAAYPHLSDIDAACLARPEFDIARPENQADAPPL